MVSQDTPLLIYDVLDDVMKFSGCKEISALMKTNHELYHRGARHLLDYDYIRFTEEHELISWMLFMEVDGGYRFSYLRGIEFGMDSLSRDTSSLLEGWLVAHAPLLLITILNLPYSETFLGARPSLANALARITTINDLRMGEIGSLSAQFIRSLRSRVTLAALDMLSLFDDDSRDLSSRDLDPIVLLKNSMNTLRALTTYRSASLQRNARSPYDEVYPGVLNLRISEATNTHFTLAYICAYPNLRSLSFNMSEDAYESIASGEAPSYDVQRRANAGAQVGHNRWNGLNFFNGSLHGLYLLALQCSVERVVLSEEYSVRPEMLDSVLRDTTPRYLHMNFFRLQVTPTALADVMRRPGAARIECFDIRANVCPKPDHNIDIATMLVCRLAALIYRPPLTHTYSQSDLIDAIHSLPAIKAVRLSIYYLCNVWVSPEYLLYQTTNGPRTPAPEIEAYLATLDLNTLAARIRDAVPSMRTIVLSLAGVPGQPDAELQDGPDYGGLTDFEANTKVKDGYSGF